MTVTTRIPAHLGGCHATSRPKCLRDDYRRALTVLATSPDGCTEAIMLAHGFKLEIVVELCRGGLARATTERIHGGGRVCDVTRVRITEAGRHALGGMK